MNFFEHQQLARRNTRLLVGLYLLAVLGVILAVDAVIAGAWIWLHAETLTAARGGPLELPAALRAVPRDLLAGGAAVTATVIGLVSLWHTHRLSGGGAVVADMAGARPVDPATHDPLEQRLLNVVEEMAIAAGVRVPQSYVMADEAGINAFAAGTQIAGAVVAVTRGALETLTRDELQGVIGHEFSHILNGDMRLNVRLLGTLQGIVFIGAIGRFIMRSVGESRGRKDGGAAGFFVLGLALFIVGAVGFGFARLIKAAVSRQREFLADAASVQFTRNPEGIAGALHQIGRHAGGARIGARHAEALSHMCFGAPVAVWFGGLFATHPPLESRIRRVHPGFRASDYLERRRALAADPQAAQEAEQRRRGAAQALLATAAVLAGNRGRRGDDRALAWGRSAGASTELVGRMTADRVDFAARLIAALPEDLHDRLHQAEGAAAALVALLLARPEAVRAAQQRGLDAAGLGALAQAANALEPSIAPLGPAFRLPLVDLALPALKRAPKAAQDALLRALEIVIHADRRVTLAEFVVLQLVRSQLSPAPPRAAAGARTLESARSEVLQVLELLCHAGRHDGADGEARSREAWRAALSAMGLPQAPMPAQSRPGAAFADALEALRALAPFAQAVLVKGLFAAVTADGTIRVAEAELLRVIGAVLDCPLPAGFEASDPLSHEA